MIMILHTDKNNYLKKYLSSEDNPVGTGVTEWSIAGPCSNGIRILFCLYGYHCVYMLFSSEKKTYNIFEPYNILNHIIYVYNIFEQKFKTN